MDFKYTTAISRIRRMKARKKVIQGGTSAGKTLAILAVLINIAAKNKTEISVVSESIPHLRRGAIKDFAKVMQWTGRWVADRWNKTLLTYHFANGSIIEFFSADSEARLRGARRQILYINEANNIDFDSYYQLALNSVPSKMEERLNSAKVAYDGLIRFKPESKYKKEADTKLAQIEIELQKFSK